MSRGVMRMESESGLLAALETGAWNVSCHVQKGHLKLNAGQGQRD